MIQIAVTTGTTSTVVMLDRVATELRYDRCRRLLYGRLFIFSVCVVRIEQEVYWSGFSRFALFELCVVQS